MPSLNLPRLVFSLALATISLGLASCAGGPTYADAKVKLPPIPKGEGRVFVYRPATMGFAVKPTVKIDDKKVGTSEGHGFFYSDQPPGTHEISITTEWKHKNSLTVIAGKPTFVECSVTPGFFAPHIIPNEIEPVKGEEGIMNCKFVDDLPDDPAFESPAKKKH